MVVAAAVMKNEGKQPNNKVENGRVLKACHCGNALNSGNGSTSSENAHLYDGVEKSDFLSENRKT